MLARILGIILLVVGGIGALGVILPLIGSIFGMLWLLIKLIIPLILIYVGYRLLNRDTDY